MSATNSHKPAGHTSQAPGRHEVKDWTTLKDQMVEIRVDGRATDRGRVDDVMADGSILWLSNDGPSGRRIIVSEPGTSVYLD